MMNLVFIESTVVILYSSCHKIIIAMHIDDILKAFSDVNETKVVISLSPEEFYM